MRTFSGIGNERPILATNQEVEIFRQAGTGCLPPMWFALDMRARLRIYIEGEKNPSIDMAMNLGHG